MQLTPLMAATAQPREKPYKLYGDQGLYLLVKPSGSKYLRMRYTFGGKEKVVSFGVYPAVSIEEAVMRTEVARRNLRDGIDPAAVKRKSREDLLFNNANTFEAVARAWHASQVRSWGEAHATAVISRLEEYIFPSLGNRPIKDIRALELLNLLKKVEQAGHIVSARRILRNCYHIFQYGVIHEQAEHNVAAGLEMGLSKSAPIKHMSSLAEKELPAFLSALRAFGGGYQTKLAMKLLLLTFVRRDELRCAMWSEFDLTKCEWRIPAERMKMADDHIVPLSEQSIEILNHLKLLNGEFKHVFVNSVRPRNVMAVNALLNAINAMGYKHQATNHGFRSTASTILNENGFDSDVIERQLAHTERNKVRASYNHAQYLPERQAMMQWWADHLTHLGL